MAKTESIVYGTILKLLEGALKEISPSSKKEEKGLKRIRGTQQGSPISPILFAIYISGFFDHIEEKIPVTTLSFADDIGIIAVESSIRDTTKTLEAAGLEAI
jgi:retron-type reverse transcriptase